MQTLIEFVRHNWGWIQYPAGFFGMMFLSSLAVTFKRYPQTRGLASILWFAVDRVSVRTFKDSPGTWSMPGAKSARPEGALMESAGDLANVQPITPPAPSSAKEKP